MRLLLGLVAIALASGSTPQLPGKLPVGIAGFKFGDSLQELKKNCGVITKDSERDGGSRFNSSGDGTIASCASVRTGVAYLPATTDVFFSLKDDKLYQISAFMPMARLLEYARALAKRRGSVVDGNVHCAQFDDGIGGVCVDLDLKRLALSL